MDVNEAAFVYYSGFEAAGGAAGGAGGLGDGGIGGVADARMALLDVVKDPMRADLRREVAYFGLNLDDYATNAALKEVIVKSFFAADLPTEAAIERQLVEEDAAFVRPAVEKLQAGNEAFKEAILVEFLALKESTLQPRFETPTVGALMVNLTSDNLTRALAMFTQGLSEAHA
jgi:hypothetical protein